MYTPDRLHLVCFQSSLVVLLAVVVVVLQEEVLISAVGGKGHSRYAQAGEGTLETVEPRELSGVAPCLADCPLVFARRILLPDPSLGSRPLTLSPRGRISAGQRR